MLDELDLYKELYYYELTTKESIDSRFNNPFSVYVVLVGGMGYLIKQFEQFPDETKSGVILTMMILYGLGLVYSGYILYKAYHGHEYAYIANPILLDNHKETIKDYYEANYEKYFSDKIETKEELIKNDFYEYLAMKFAECSTHNQNINHIKADLFLKTGRSLLFNSVMWAIIFILITLFKK